MAGWRSSALAVVALAGLAAEARAVEAQAVEPLEEDPGASSVNVDVGLLSAYNFRGLNVFATGSQLDQHAFAAPSITWSLGSFTLGYWGAFQLVGDNVSAAIDAGLGAEQDLILGYALELRDDVSVSASVASYLYPVADEAAAGTSLPMYLEPGAGVSWSGPIDAGLKLSYLHGVQEALSAARYVYVNPTVGKSFELRPTMSLALTLGYGLKLFNDGAVEDNVHDLLASAALAVDLGGVYVRPSLGLGWTNLAARGVADELVFAGGANVGKDF